MSQLTTKEFVTGLIAFARDKKGWKPKDVAARMESDTQYVWQIENNSKGISCARIDLFIKTLGMTTEEFWGLVPEYLEHLKAEKMLQQN